MEIVYACKLVSAHERSAEILAYFDPPDVRAGKMPLNEACFLAEEFDRAFDLFLGYVVEIAEEDILKRQIIRRQRL